MALKSYRELIVWQKAIDIVEVTYKIAERFPRTEQFGLVSQLQRAIVSIASNIAEGAGRGHTREFLQHLNVARGSLYEAETQIIAQRLGYITEETASPFFLLSGEVGKLIHGLASSLERKLTQT